jgi:bisphosphoglycerate-independent phosphoglycerate mutase (AlkP superfamily)
VKFIELTLKNHIILHGFDDQNQEITEEVEVEEASKKVVAVSRILSISKKYILIQYAYDRIVYWEYMEDYEAIKEILTQ